MRENSTIAADAPTADANKTPLTHQVTAAVQLWLEAKGFKPVETEVPVTSRWIADLAGVLCPTRTEAIDLKLMPRKPSYVRRADEDFEAYQNRYHTWNALFEQLPAIMTTLVEVKTSRSDFIGDWKWKEVAPTCLMYLATPSGLITEDEVPEGWGWLVVSDIARQKRAPIIHRPTTDQVLNATLAIAIRRDHHTRYARLREAQKRHRCVQADQRAHSRIGTLVDAVMDVIEGKQTFDEAFKWNGLKMPPYLKKRCEQRVAQVKTSWEWRTPEYYI